MKSPQGCLKFTPANKDALDSPEPTLNPKENRENFPRQPDEKIIRGSKSGGSISAYGR